jgi:Fe-S oxidoreductase/nitrate reductase gamma subunit
MWTRDIFWNIGSGKKIYVYCLALIAIGLFAYGLYKRYVLWKMGCRGERRFTFKLLTKRMSDVIIDGLFQRRLLKEWYPGSMHAFLLWGMLILFLGTITIALQENIILPMTGVRILEGYFYLYYKLILNIAGILALLGSLMALWRRYITKPARLTQSAGNAIILIWILAILVTGFILEGLRIYSLKNKWEVWSIGGWIVKAILDDLEIREISGITIHKVVWWSHLLSSLGLIAVIPFSKLLHLVTSPANIFIHSTTAQAVLSPIKTFKRGESFGVSEVRDFTKTQIVEFDACTQCGRCEERCPAHLSGKPLSPKKVIEELKAEWLEVGKLMRKGDVIQVKRRKEKKEKASEELMHEDIIWACTFCMACSDNCPVFINPFDKIIELRRDLVLMKSKFFPEIGTLFRNIETFGDTFGKGRAFREEWAADIDIKRISKGVQTDILFWIGCEGSFHNRISPIAASLARLFKKAKIDFGILGSEENCCGDPIRRIGNEYLFQKIALRNIRLLESLKFKKIVTYCPHCFNMLKNEYSQFGGHFEVLHYTEFLRDLLRDGIISATKEIDRKITYHDSCFLARANNIYECPRDILKSIPGISLLEPVNSLRDTFCCGAGGGHMWMREVPGGKISEARMKELVEVKPEMILSSCPYCLLMFEDAAKSMGVEHVRCGDLVEIIAEAI